MNISISWTARMLGGVLSSLLLLVFVLPSPAQADNTRTRIDQFEIVRATSSYSRWTTAGCMDEDDIDDGCYVKVTADKDLRDYIQDDLTGSNAEKWKTLFEQSSMCGGLDDDDSYKQLNEDFNECWEDGNSEGSATVEWPTLDPSEHFEASGFCRSGDPICAITITICYNADECDGRSSNDDEFEEDDGAKAQFFDDNESCLYDVRRDTFTTCVNRGLRRVYDYLQGRGRYTYQALETELERRGVKIESYTHTTSRVRDPSYFATYVYGPVLPRSSTSYVPSPSYAPSPSYVPSPRGSLTPSGRYLIANFTQYLEAQPYTRICDTAQGCINVIGESQFFRSYIGNLSVRITDPTVLNCMTRRGYASGGGYEVAFGHPDLVACDQRVARATSLCPAPGTGAKSELLAMYNLGLLSSLISPALAHSMQNELNTASYTTPGCLCNAGFRYGEILSSTSTTTDPWQAGAAVSSAQICY